MKLNGFYVHNIRKRYSWNMVVLVVVLLLAVLRPVQSSLFNREMKMLFVSSIFLLNKRSAPKWV